MSDEDVIYLEAKLESASDSDRADIISNILDTYYNIPIRMKDILKSNYEPLMRKLSKGEII